MKVIERIANLAIIVAAAVFLVLVVQGKFFRSAPAVPARPATAQVGSTVTLPGVRFPAQRDSLLLGISATCHFCRDSLPFYKQLAAQLQGKVNVIAVLPQKQAEAGAFIEQAGITGVEVVSANLDNIGVRDQVARETTSLSVNRTRLATACPSREQTACSSASITSISPIIIA